MGAAVARLVADLAIRGALLVLDKVGQRVDREACEKMRLRALDRVYERARAWQADRDRIWSGVTDAE